MNRRRSITHALLANTVLAFAALAIVVATLALPRAAHAEDIAKTVIKHVNVDEKLDAPLPFDAQFLDHTGKAVRLGEAFDGKRPVLLVLAYHSCPVLCGMVQSAAATALKNVKWTVGKEFDVVVLSIDPKDTPEKAAQKRAGIIAAYGRPGSDPGFHFYVGAKTQIDRVADAIGFKYEYDPEQQQYGHPAVIMFTKPSGEMARYLYGLEFDPNDVRIALFEASNGKSISTIEKVILYCYQYNPHDGKYVVLASRVMKLGGALTVLVLGTFLAFMWANERRRARSVARAENLSPPTPSGA